VRGLCRSGAEKADRARSVRGRSLGSLRQESDGCYCDGNKEGSVERNGLHHVRGFGEPYSSGARKDHEGTQIRGKNARPAAVNEFPRVRCRGGGLRIKGSTGRVVRGRIDRLEARRIYEAGDSSGHEGGSSMFFIDVPPTRERQEAWERDFLPPRVVPKSLTTTSTHRPLEKAFLLHCSEM